MSHIEKCSVVITDLKALKPACETLGLTLSEGQKKFVGYYGAKNPCQHAIKVPGVSWEVGLLSADTEGNKVKGWTTAFDPFGTQGQTIASKLCKKHGEQYGQPVYKHKDGTHHCETLMNQYSLEVLKAKARAKGYQFKQTTVDGKIKLQVTLGN
jgi:hypothetical protein